jgi:hypothetical protein
VKPIEEMSQAELGAFVQTHLRKEGIEVVLSGGAAVGIYSSGKYISKDLDMVRMHMAKRQAIRSALATIGFQEDQGKYFKHPKSDHLIDFRQDPPSVGDEALGSINEIRYPTGLLKVISPTDCVKDRLAGYYHFNDHQSLEQALLVANENDIDLTEIELWSKREGMLGRFKGFRDRLIRGHSASTQQRGDSHAHH